MKNLQANFQKIYEAVNSLETTVNDSLIPIIQKAAFVKNVEFNLQICENSTNPYFLMPFLRGLAEDLIILMYLDKVVEPDDQDTFILYYQLKDLTKSVDSQEEFFNKERIVQQVIIPEMIPEAYQNFETLKKDFKTLAKKFNWRRKKYPCVDEMAQAVQMKDFYKYIYHSTSRTVHFNPHLLLSLCWGKKSELSKEISYEISTKILAKYYREFCRWYGWSIFTKLYSYFRDDFSSSPQTLIDSCLDEIKLEFKGSRWPELVTFEEMNISIEEGMKMYDLIKFGEAHFAGNVLLGRYDLNKNKV